MTNERSILDLDEEVLDFINDFLIDQALTIEPELDVKNLAVSRDLIGLQASDKEIFYFYKNTPLLFLDLNLLIDGT